MLVMWGVSRGAIGAAHIGSIDMGSAGATWKHNEQYASLLGTSCVRVAAVMVALATDDFAEYSETSIPACEMRRLKNITRDGGRECCIRWGHEPKRARQPQRQCARNARHVAAKPATESHSVHRTFDATVHRVCLSKSFFVVELSGLLPLGSEVHCRVSR